ncbi:unnamed protein product [Symbiodinium microadriaticum]|nr:unnamed protein product [Symbiodinium microadriaticum]
MANVAKFQSAARLIRIQLKSGYIREAPESYLFLRRYPPVVRDEKPPVEKFTTTHLPYMGLYDKAVERNALYADERAYPAYWKAEPEALILAKKQYQLMQHGIDEETAYVRAMKYVNNLESAAYEETEQILNMMKEKGVTVSIVADDSVLDEIAHWRQVLADTRYSKLGLAEKGAIDYLIQTKILKWDEIQRERRMKDPIFYKQFQELRASVFPEIQSELSIHQAEALAKERTKFKSEVFSKYRVNESQLSSAAPFFLEDYEFYFRKLQSEPLLTKWNESDRSTFFRWIVNTLALRDVLKTSSSSRVQHYLEDIRNKFFPMVKYPERASEFQLPDVQGLKALLYKNDIGYRKQNDKVYVRRHYRLPALLFPEETAEPVRLYKHENSFDSFSGGGLTLKNKSVEEIRRELEPRVGAASVKDVSLDDLLRDESGDEAEAGDEPVESVLRDLDEDAATGADVTLNDRTAGTPDVDVSEETSTESEKVYVELTRKEYARAMADENPTVKDLLKTQVTLGLVPLEVELKQECRQMLKKLRKVVQSEVMQQVLGERFVEPENPEDDYPFEIERLSLKKLEKLHKAIKDVAVLGRASTAQERMLMVEKYDPAEKSKLEQLREKYLQECTRTSYDYCVTEDEFEHVYNARQEFMILGRAHIAVQFEQQEGARRAVEWEERGVLDPDELPRVTMPFTDRN